MRTPSISAEESGAIITSPMDFSPRDGTPSSSPLRSPMGSIASRIGACCVCAVMSLDSPLCRNCFLDLLWLLLAAPGTLFKNLQPLRQSLFDRVLCGHFASARFSQAPSQLRVFDERFELFEPLPRGCR